MPNSERNRKMANNILEIAGLVLFVIILSQTNIAKIGCL